MRTDLSRLGLVLAGSAALITGACGGSTKLTTFDDDMPMMKATTQNEAAAPVSATIRGSVVDTSSRLLANVNIECLGDVQCTGPNHDVSADGHEHRIARTDANGTFEIVASSLPGSSSRSFMMNANGQGYQVAWQTVAWPAAGCSSDQARCAVTVNFKLNPTSDPAE